MRYLLPVLLGCSILFAGCEHDIAARTVEYEVSSTPASSVKINYSVPGKPDVLEVRNSGWKTSYMVGKDNNFQARISANYNGQNTDVTLKIYVDGKLVKERTADLNNTNHPVQTIDYLVK